MFPQLYTATSGMVAGEQTLDLVTGNLANVRTPAYRPDRPLFYTYLSQVTQSLVPGGKPVIPREVWLRGAWRPDSQGPLRETGSDFDVAFQGKGWFQVETPQGVRLTRAGSFTRDQEGILRTVTGYPVLDQNGQRIRIPQGKLGFGGDGTVTVDDAPLARLGLVTAPEGTIFREGDTLWRSEAKTTPLTSTDGTIRQGFIEESAVNATTELVSMIAAQRLYEQQQKLVDLTANTLARKAIELGDVR